jgi:general stress protein CsbA
VFLQAAAYSRRNGAFYLFLAVNCFNRVTKQWFVCLFLFFVLITTGIWNVSTKLSFLMSSVILELDFCGIFQVCE